MKDKPVITKEMIDAELSKTIEGLIDKLAAQEIIIDKAYQLLQMWTPDYPSDDAKTLMLDMWRIKQKYLN